MGVIAPIHSRRINPALTPVLGVDSDSADQSISMNKVGIEARIQKSVPLPILIKGITINKFDQVPIELTLNLPLKIHQRINPSKSTKMAYKSTKMAYNPQPTDWICAADVLDWTFWRKYKREIPSIIPPPRIFSIVSKDRTSWISREKK